MKIRSFTTTKKFLRNSLQVTAMIFFGASQICQSASAQTATPDPNAIQIFNTAVYQYSFPNPNSNYPPGTFPPYTNKLEYQLTGDTNKDKDGGNFAYLRTLSYPTAKLEASLTDPFGRVTSCDGGLLSDYTGFSVGLYEPLNDFGDIGVATKLTETRRPDEVSNKSIGQDPNFQNSNPFFLTNGDQGKFAFLFDDTKGQLDIGRTYILFVKPPANSVLGARRIKIRINSTFTKLDPITNKTIKSATYTATSLDDQGISTLDGGKSVDGVIEVADAQSIGLGLAAFTPKQLSTKICEAVSLQILKTGDRAAAQPGDIVIYRLSIRNLSNSIITEPIIRDDLPLGFQYADKSVRADFGGSQIPVTIEQNGRNLVFSFSSGFDLPSAKSSSVNVLTIVYAAQLTNDAIRGTGINRASVQGKRNGTIVKDGPVSHKLRIRPGILSDCGTLVGRVFVDKNFDGEQQPGEPGVPNAVIYMDDGNRIVTDANGLFSLSSVLSGSRTLAIDLTSVPGYTLAPNLYFAERNSQSRLVRLAPGSLNRVNFAVTPVARGLSGNIDGKSKQDGVK